MSLFLIDNNLAIVLLKPTAMLSNYYTAHLSLKWRIDCHKETGGDLSTMSGIMFVSDIYCLCSTLEGK